MKKERNGGHDFYCLTNPHRLVSFKVSYKILFWRTQVHQSPTQLQYTYSISKVPWLDSKFCYRLTYAIDPEEKGMVDVDKTERRMAFRPFFLSREHYLGWGVSYWKRHTMFASVEELKSTYCWAALLTDEFKGNKSRFDARYWMLGASALGRPRGMVWGGRREEGSGWGIHVYLWWIHFDIWQN